jgi:hypothetical protein
MRTAAESGRAEADSRTAGPPALIRVHWHAKRAASATLAGTVPRAPRAIGRCRGRPRVFEGSRKPPSPQSARKTRPPGVPARHAR